MTRFIPRAWLTDECIAAAEGQPPKGQTIPVFRSRFIDRWLARAHPIVPILWCGPIAAIGTGRFLASGGSLSSALALFGAGWLSFSLMEYLLHRFVFHRSFADTPDGRLDDFLTHGYHHHYANDRTRLVMPPIIAWPLALGVWTLLWLAFGAITAGALFSGVVLSYVAYDWIHYYTHHARPTTALGRWIRRYHLLHHHDDPNARFGVSSPLWDVAFGTFVPVDKLQRKGRRKVHAPSSSPTPGAV